MNYSPLRYPGGKTKLNALITAIIAQYKGEITKYFEPFAGGASIALSLLANNTVKRIALNDIDTAIYSFWRAILQSPDLFIKRLNETTPSLETYERQKQIYRNEKTPSFELGFAAFFLNRTNFSGILKANPIGGQRQNGANRLGDRFNKKTLTQKLEKIATLAPYIEVTNQNAIDLIKRIETTSEKTFTYFDPPYFVKGSALYPYALNEKEHITLSEQISKMRSDWLATYDNVPQIYKLYERYKPLTFNLSYTINPNAYKRGVELLITNALEKIEDIPAELKEKYALYR